MAAMFEKVMGRPIRHAEISEVEQGEIFAKMGLPKYTVNGLIETFSLVRGRAVRLPYRVTLRK